MSCAFSYQFPYTYIQKWSIKSTSRRGCVREQEGGGGRLVLKEEAAAEQWRLPSFLDMFQKVQQWNVLQAAHRRLWEAKAGSLETLAESLKMTTDTLCPEVKRSPIIPAASKCSVQMKVVPVSGYVREALTHSSPQLPSPTPTPALPAPRPLFFSLHSPHLLPSPIFSLKSFFWGEGEHVEWGQKQTDLFEFKPAWSLY